jgi:RNA polymerase sigma-70 factor (ECF subfamily)
MTAAPAALPHPVLPTDIDRLYREHHAMILRTAFRITRNMRDAEDVLHSLFLRLIEREAGPDPGTNPGPYLHRAAVNLSLDLLRKRRRGAALEAMPAGRGSGESQPDELSARAELGDRLRAAIARLSPRGAEVFVLRHVEGYTNAEIAQMLGLSWGVVAVTLLRARRRLQKDMQL